MKKLFAISVLVLLALLSMTVVSSCAARAPAAEEEKTPVEKEACSPRDNAEAEDMALVISGELFAPEELYQKVLRDLEAIRSKYGKDIEPISRIKFRAPWSTTSLLVCYDKEAVSDAAHPWHILKQKYRLAKVEGKWGEWLFFECRMHPRRLAESYLALPDVTCAEPNIFMGDQPNIYPQQIGGEITYIFRDAWGDCPSGCIHSEYWYFTFNETDQPVLVGHWNPQIDPQKPEWYQGTNVESVAY